MNNSIVIGTVLGVTVALAGGLFAGYQLISGVDRPAPRVAMPLALAAMPVTECSSVERRDGSRITGTVVSTLAGAGLGKDVGDREMTTSAVAGVVGGNQLQKRIQDRAAHAC